MNKLIFPASIRARITIQTAAKKMISCIEVDSFVELAHKIDRFTKSGDAVFIEYTRGFIPDSFACKRGTKLMFVGDLTPIKLDTLRKAA